MVEKYKKKNLLEEPSLGELPLDVLFHIYTFCDSEEKRILTRYLVDIYYISILISLLFINTFMYCLGTLITGKFLGFYLIFNILLGYLLLAGLGLVLIFIFIVFNLIIKLLQGQY